MSEKPALYVVTDIKIVTAALMSLIDAEYQHLIRTRNTFRISEARGHYEKGLSAVKELDTMLGHESTDRACVFLRAVDPIAYGIPPGSTEPKVA